MRRVNANRQTKTIRRTVAFALAATLATGLSSPAQARAPKPGAYILLAPGLVYLPLGDDDFEDEFDPGYSWGLGIGGVFSPGRSPFTIGLGFGFDHQILNWDDDIRDAADNLNCDLSAHAFRMSPELRLGATFDRFFGYGILAPGLAIARRDYDDCNVGPFGFSGDRTDFGFNLKTGGGIQITLTDHFGVGAEMVGNFAFMEIDEDDDWPAAADDDYTMKTLDLRALLFWRF
jgi:hypothetical protein